LLVGLKPRLVELQNTFRVLPAVLGGFYQAFVVRRQHPRRNGHVHGREAMRRQERLSAKRAGAPVTACCNSLSRQRPRIPGGCMRPDVREIRTMKHDSNGAQISPINFDLSSTDSDYCETSRKTMPHLPVVAVDQLPLRSDVPVPAAPAPIPVVAVPCA
jgi:hypothetical protein